MIRVESEKKNARGEKIAYDLMPVRHGTPRHNEQFTRHDLWVSKSHPERPTEFLFANLPNIVKDEEVVEQTDIVLWCNSAVHHEPRNEDGKANSGPRLWAFDDAWEGSAIVMWSGLDLRPRNLFDRTPFYPYTPAPVRPLASQPARRRPQASARRRGRPRLSRRETIARPNGESEGGRRNTLIDGGRPAREERRQPRMSAIQTPAPSRFQWPRSRKFTLFATTSRNRFGQERPRGSKTTSRDWEASRTLARPCSSH